MKKNSFFMMAIFFVAIFLSVTVSAQNTNWVQDGLLLSSDGKMLSVSSFVSSIDNKTIPSHVDTIRSYNNSSVERWVRDHGWKVSSVSPEYTEFSRKGFLALKIDGMEAGDEYWSIRRRKTQEQYINTIGNITGPFTSNKEAQDYETVNDAAKSYLVPFDDGSMMIVRIEKDILIRYLDKHFRETEKKDLQMELPLFGGFHVSSDGSYFFIEGRENPRNSDKSEVIRIIQYDSKWKRVNSCSLYGANTTIPFIGGLHCTELDNHLYIRTGHVMYTAKDGLQHQANMAIDLNKVTMKLVYSMDGVDIIGNSQYVSHSFNQLVATKNGIMVGVDHGDAYPRTLVLGKNKRGLHETDGGNGAYSYVPLCNIPGSVGDNFTGTSLGDIAVSDTHYLVAYNQVYDESFKNKSKKTRNIFLASVQDAKGGFEKSTVKMVTDYAQGMDPARTPYLVCYGRNKFLLMWTRHTTVFYTTVDGSGKTGVIHSFEGALSDCKPVLCGGFITWFVTDGSRISFYRIDAQHIDWGASASSGTVKAPETSSQETEIDFPEKPQIEPEPQPEPEKPQVEPEPQPEPEKPQVEPEPQPEPEKPQVEPKPQPEPEKPKEPAKPRIPRSVEIAKKGLAVSCKNYEYETGDFTTSDKCYIWDFSEYISDPGQYTILFNYQSGVGIVMSEAALLVDGEFYAAFPDSKKIDRNSRKGTYIFNLPSKAKKVQLTAYVRALDRGKFYGTIDIIHDMTLIIPRGRRVLLYEEFSERKDFNKVIFPDTLVEIGGYSLERTPLEKIEIPGNIKKIGNFAFFDMKNLQEIVMHEGVEELGEYCVDTREYNVVTVTVPDSMSVFGRFCITNNSIWKINKGSKADEYAKKQHFVSIIYLNVTFATPPDQQIVMPQEPVVPPGTMKNYAYETGDFTQSDTSYVWDFSPYIKNAGKYSILFSRRTGASLIISKAVIVADGKQVAAQPQSQTADAKNRIAITFNLPANARKVELKATARMASSGSYKGTIDILMGTTLIIPTGRTVTEREEFYKRTDFTSILFPPTITEIGNSSFESCALKTVDIPGTVKKLDRYAFFGCNSLSEVKLQEGVAEIGEWAFCGTKTKFRIYIPASIAEFPGGVTENMAIWVVYKGSSAEAYAKKRNYTIEFRYVEP